MDRPTIKIFGFRTTYHKKTGSAELVARDWVKYAPTHNISTVTEEMVNHLRPPENGLDRDDEGLKMGYMQALWTQIEPHYRAWKDGTEVPASGIPLSAWAGVTAEEAEVFRASGVKTVEDVAGLTEGQITKIMLPNIRAKKQMAAEFLASRSGADTAAKVAALSDANASLQAQLEEMARMIAGMQRTREVASNDDEDEDQAPVKRGRGRPRKADLEDAA